MSWAWPAVGLAAAVVVGIAVRFVWGLCWARFRGVGVTARQLLGICLAPQSPRPLLAALAALRRAGIWNVDLGDLVTHRACGGRVRRSVEALVRAKAQGVDASWPFLTALDLEGRDPVALVERGTTPWSLSVPFDGRALRIAAGDGTRVELAARATVRAEPDERGLLSSEQALAGRIEVALQEAMRAAPSHAPLLDRPEILADAAVDAGVAWDSGFQLLSLRIYRLRVLDAGSD